MAIGVSCSAEYQPGSGTDIALWVAGSTTSVEGALAERVVAVAAAPTVGAAVVVPPVPTKTAIVAAITATATSAGTSSCLRSHPSRRAAGRGRSSPGAGGR